MNKVRILRISVELLFQMFAAGTCQPGYRVIADGIPPDAELVNVQHAWRNSVELLIRSEMFSPVEPGKEIPHLTPKMERLPA